VAAPLPLRGGPLRAVGKKTASEREETRLGRLLGVSLPVSRRAFAATGYGCALSRRASRKFSTLFNSRFATGLSIKQQYLQMLICVLGTLNELQARVFVAQRAVQEGWGGVSRVARLTGMSRPRILKGIAEPESGTIEARAKRGQSALYRRWRLPAA
jgi:hypothetical protein